ncbi:extracellular calcium-sensing receptor-like [Leptodactylus fuscus]|uniref:extracellular calcium-sensing receptor-like n=1 Tax=Leptodactylus fuscus TaxID=238119 RepID=UPI003F4E867D
MKSGEFGAKVLQLFVTFLQPFQSDIHMMPGPKISHRNIAQSITLPLLTALLPKMHPGALTPKGLSVMTSGQHGYPTKLHTRQVMMPCLHEPMDQSQVSPVLQGITGMARRSRKRTEEAGNVHKGTQEMGVKRCALDTPDLLGISASGDILFGAVLPLHMEKEYPKLMYTEKPRPAICKKLTLETYLQLHVVKYATMEINSNPDLLPNITLGYHIYDSCSVLQRELEGTIWMMTGDTKAVPNFQCRRKEKLAAIIGHSTSTYSILMAHILGLTRYPQISHLSTSSLLSDKTQYPSFFRTVPSDAFQSKGLAQLVLHFSWTWVGLVALANDYGQQGIQVIKQEILKSGACVEFTEYIQIGKPDSNVPHIGQVIKDSTAQAVVIFSTDVHFLPLLEELLRLNVTEKIWVASEAWSTTSLFSAKKFAKVLAGTIGFAFYRGNIPGFQNYLDHLDPTSLPEKHWNWMFWEANVGCTFLDLENVAFPGQRPSRNCTDKDNITDFHIYLRHVSNIRMSYNLYSAIYVIAKTLYDLNTCRWRNGRSVDKSCSDFWNFTPWQILKYMKTARVTLSGGRDMFFDINGDPPPVYHIVNWQMGSDGGLVQVNVGQYDSSSLIINRSSIRWNVDDTKVPTSVCSERCPPGFRKAPLSRKPTCCFQCIPCALGEITNNSDANECLKCPWDQWPNQEKDKCLPKLMEYLSDEKTLGIFLMSTSITSSIIPLVVLGLLIHYKATPVVKANNYAVSCLLLVAMSLCFLTSLALIGYPNHIKCLLRQVTFGMAFAFCVSCILAKTVMVMIAFRATKPNSGLTKWARPEVSYLVIGLGTSLQLLISVTWLLFAPPYPQYNLNAKSGVIIAECNEGSLVAFWCTIGYLGLLALASFLVAFLARHLPGNYNEARFITFSMLAFLSVWVSYIPASLSTSGKYTVAMEIFAIISSNWAMLGCMFAPKCYIILFRPNMNSREHFLGRR